MVNIARVVSVGLASKVPDLFSTMSSAARVFVGTGFHEVVPSDIETVAVTRGSHIRLGRAEPLIVNGETVCAGFRDMCAISPEVALVAEAIRVGRLTFYQTSIRQETKMKREIARKCIQLIGSNTALACGPGSTVAHIVSALVEVRRYRVIATNNMGIMDQVGRSRLSNLVLGGGEYNGGIQACVGDGALKGFERAPCHGALIGAAGINGGGDLFVRYSEEEIAVVNAIARCATHRVYIVADALKLGQTDLWRYVTIREFLEEKPHLGEEELPLGALDEFSQWVQGDSEIRRDLSYDGSEFAREGGRSLRTWPMMSSRTFGTFARAGRFDARCKTYHVDSVDGADVAGFAYN